MKHVLVIGASGLLGQYLLSEARARGYSAEGTYQSSPVPGLSRADLTDPDGLQSVIRDLGPDLVLLPAAMTSVDGCEAQPSLARNVNSEAPSTVAKECADLDVKLVYFSTDYVFNGLQGPSDEEKKPEPLSIYGKTKLDGERRVAAARPGSLIIRTCANFGWNRLRRKANSVTWILAALREGRKAALFTDQWVSPSYAPAVARHTFSLVEQGAKGVFHIAAPDCLTRLEMGQAVCAVFELPRQLLGKAKLSEARLSAPRPRRSCLSVAKVERTLNITMSPFHDALREMRSTE